MKWGNSKNAPPGFGKWLLRSFCSYDFLNTALWDLEEIYRSNLKELGKTRADLLYLWQAIGVVFHLYFKGKSYHTSNRTAMLKNNIILSFRNLTRNKVYTLLNTLGLTSALIVFTLISLYVSNEFSYDQYHKNKDQIYRVYQEMRNMNYLGSNKFAGAPAPLAPAFTTDFPEIAFATRFDKSSNVLIKANDQIFMEPVVYATDAETFQMFSFETIVGDIQKFLTEKNTVVLSEFAALKYFGKIDVVGEVIHFSNEHPMQVVGVIKDMPANSHFKMDVTFQFETILELNNRSLTTWQDFSYYTYIMLAPGVNPDSLQSKFPEFRARHANDPIDEDGQSMAYHLQLLPEVHFAQGINFEIVPTTNAQRLYVFLGVAFMILLIAGINYVNLATAHAIKRTKEIGIRKVVGAQSKNLIFQFLMESFLLISMAMIIALLCTSLILPTFSQFFGKDLSLDFTDPTLLLFLGGLCLGLSFFSGIYPALVLTSFRPVSALKGKLNNRGVRLRNALVVFQFIISSVLILGTIVLSKQLNYIQNVDVGYTRDQIVVLNIKDEGLRKQLPVFREELRKIAGVMAVSSSESLPNNIYGGTKDVQWSGKTESVLFNLGHIDYDFVKFYGLELFSGRNFQPEIESDKMGILLNESAMSIVGWEDPIGQQVVSWGDTLKVVGVLKDFHHHSLHEGIKPLLLRLGDKEAVTSIKIAGTRLKETLQAIETKYDGFSPEYPFEYNYFDDIFDRAYLAEIKTAKLASWFAALTILIACLGLYGLASYKVEQRIKEVGIRKVLGASVPKILTLLSKDFVRLLIIAFLIAAPIAYYVMEGWLNNFAYHISIGLFTFIITLVIMILIAGLAVGQRTYKAAIRNPVESLRNE